MSVRELAHLEIAYRVWRLAVSCTKQGHSIKLPAAPAVQGQCKASSRVEQDWFSQHAMHLPPVFMAAVGCVMPRSPGQDSCTATSHGSVACNLLEFLLQEVALRR